MDVKRWPPNAVWRVQRHECHGAEIPLVRIAERKRKLQYLPGNSLAKVRALFSKFIRSFNWYEVNFARSVSSQVLANVGHERQGENKFSFFLLFFALSSNQQDE